MRCVHVLLPLEMPPHARRDPNRMPHLRLLLHVAPSPHGLTRCARSAGGAAARASTASGGAAALRPYRACRRRPAATSETTSPIRNIRDSGRSSSVLPLPFVTAPPPPVPHEAADWFGPAVTSARTHAAQTNPPRNSRTSRRASATNPETGSKFRAHSPIFNPVQRARSATCTKLMDFPSPC